MSYENF